MPSNDILDAELRRVVAQQRYGTTLVNEQITPTAQRLSRSLPPLVYDTGASPSRTELNRLTAAIRAEVAREWSPMWDDITVELQRLAQIEAEAVTGIYQEYTPDVVVRPTPEQVAAATQTAIMTLTGATVESGVWAQFVRNNLNSTTRLIASTVRNGFNTGLTLAEIVQQLRGRYNRRTRRYVGGVVNNKSTAWAEALARTGISHYSNVARDQFEQANSDVISGRYLFATLDNRTTTICLGRHLNFYPEGEPFPPLPFHYNERSVYIFKTPGFDPLNVEFGATGGQDGAAAREAYEARDQRLDRTRDRRAEQRADGQTTPETPSKVRYRGRKDSNVFDVEQISARTSSDSWLRSQPRWFVESTLGKERARLFLDDKYSINRFTDMTGRPLTLDELKP